MKIAIAFGGSRVDIFGAQLVVIEALGRPPFLYLFKKCDIWILMVSTPFLPDNYMETTLQLNPRIKGEAYPKLSWEEKEYYLKKINAFTPFNKGDDFLSIERLNNDDEFTLSHSLNFFDEEQRFKALAIWPFSGQ